ncbi:MAG: hypothetical protein E7055_05340 [Lentisphaerae bacterium]|nr:hypothetical protein [Lentisphaerota bacterium]
MSRSYIAIDLKSFYASPATTRQHRTVRAVRRADELRGGSRGNCPADRRKAHISRQLPAGKSAGGFNAGKVIDTYFGSSFTCLFSGLFKRWLTSFLNFFQDFP